MIRSTSEFLRNSKKSIDFCGKIRSPSGCLNPQSPDRIKLAEPHFGPHEPLVSLEGHDSENFDESSVAKDLRLVGFRNKTTRKPNNSIK